MDARRPVVQFFTVTTGIGCRPVVRWYLVPCDDPVAAPGGEFELAFLRADGDLGAGATKSDDHVHGVLERYPSGCEGGDEAVDAPAPAIPEDCVVVRQHWYFRQH